MQQTALLLLAVGSAAASSSQSSTSFDAFKISHNKEYSSEDEHDKRLGVFSDNMRLVEEMNKALAEEGNDEIHGVTR